MAIYYVDNITGDDANTGLAEGTGNAWSSLSKAMATVVAGDKVYIKGGTPYTQQDGTTGTIATAITAGTLAAPIQLEGYTTIPGDGGQAILDAQNTLTTCTAGALTGWYYIFKNLICQNAVEDGWSINSLTGDNVFFRNCIARYNGRNGIRMDNTATLHLCTIAENGSVGVLADNSAYFTACRITGNAATGVDLEIYGSFNNCIIDRNLGTRQIRMNGLGQIANCVIDGNGVAGMTGIVQDRTTASVFTVINNIFYGLDVGVRDDTLSGQGVDASQMQEVDNNMFVNVTTPYDIWEAGEGDIITNIDPFVDRVNGDYRLKAGSQAIGAGIDAGAL